MDLAARERNPARRRRCRMTSQYEKDLGASPRSFARTAHSTREFPMRITRQTGLQMQRTQEKH